MVLINITQLYKFKFRFRFFLSQTLMIIQSLVMGVTMAYKVLGISKRDHILKSLNRAEIKEKATEDKPDVRFVSILMFVGYDPQCRKISYWKFLQVELLWTSLEQWRVNDYYGSSHRSVTRDEMLPIVASAYIIYINWLIRITNLCSSKRERENAKISEPKLTKQTFDSRCTWAG